MITPTVNYNDSQETKQSQTSLAFDQETKRTFLHLETRLENLTLFGSTSKNYLDYSKCAYLLGSIQQSSTH